MGYILQRRDMYLKNERLEWKRGPVGEWVLVGGGRVNGEGEWRAIRSMYFAYLYENRIMKFVEIILSMREGGEGEWWS
jgi:hypothetical protein